MNCAIGGTPLGVERVASEGKKDSKGTSPAAHWTSWASVRALNEGAGAGAQRSVASRGSSSA